MAKPVSPVLTVLKKIRRLYANPSRFIKYEACCKTGKYTRHCLLGAVQKYTKGNFELQDKCFCVLENCIENNRLTNTLAAYNDKYQHSFRPEEPLAKTLQSLRV